MNGFATLFVALLAAGVATRLWLNLRQVKAVRARRGQPPAVFADQIDVVSHQKAADYTVASARVSRFDALLDAGIALFLTVGGGVALIDAWWRVVDLPEVVRGALVVMSCLLLVSLLGLPFSIWRTFGVEARFGFNRTTPRLYIVDLLKSLLITLALGGPLLLVVLYLMERAGDAWWLYAWAVWAGFSVLMMWAWPAFIAPLFNKFTPLADEALKRSTEALLARVGFASRGVFVMDGSRRSVHGNAYFTGVGRNKRIVFFDTLLERLQIPEIEAVLAHELGHFKLHHVRARLALTLAVSLGGFWVLGALADWPAFYRAFGVEQPSSHVALLLFLFVLPAFTYFLTPLGAWWSRKHEFEADEFAARHADAGRLADALVKLYRDNATTLTPDALHSAFYDSHPPALVRIARLRNVPAPRL
jgi:STE24 endopeptidase